MNSLIIGFGKMGMLHASILNSLDDIQTLAVSESSSFIRDGLKVMNAPFSSYENYKEALSSASFDLAVVATPNDSHFSIFKDLLEKNISVFIEKPFVTSSEEAREALKIVSKSRGNAKVMVGNCLRFVPIFEKAKEILNERKLGKILHFEAKMYSSDVETAQSGWRFDKSAKGGGVLLDLGSHLIDLARYFFGMPENVSGHTERWYSKHVEDYFHAIFDYGEMTGVVEASWSVPGIRKPAAEFVITGEKGQMFVSNDSLRITGENQAKFDASQFVTPVPFDLAGPFYTRQLMEFVEAVKTGKANRNGINEAVENHTLIDAIRESGYKPVKIKGTKA